MNRADLALLAVVWIMFAIGAAVFTTRAWPERMYTVVGGAFLAIGLAGEGVYHCYLAVSGRTPWWLCFEPPR